MLVYQRVHVHIDVHNYTFVKYMCIQHTYILAGGFKLSEKYEFVSHKIHVPNHQPDIVYYNILNSINVHMAMAMYMRHSAAQDTPNLFDR